MALRCSRSQLNLTARPVESPDGYVTYVLIPDFCEVVPVAPLNRFEDFAHLTFPRSTDLLDHQTLDAAGCAPPSPLPGVLSVMPRKIVVFITEPIEYFIERIKSKRRHWENPTVGKFDVLPCQQVNYFERPISN